MLPLFWRNQLSRNFLGTAFGLCLALYTHAQTETAPLATPSSAEYPGILQTFETLVTVDNTKYKNISDALIKLPQNLSDIKETGPLSLQPDFLNSVILHSNAGYLKLASSDKCRFYDTIVADLLKSAEGKIKHVMVSYKNKAGENQSTLLTKKDFLNNVVNQECPETASLINQFQIKTINQTLSQIDFEIPTSPAQCHSVHQNWLSNSKTPYLCQIYEFMKETKAGAGDLKDLPQRQAVTKILDSKLSVVQKDYIENLCKHLDNEDLFCHEFLNVSFWTKIASGREKNIFAEGICKNILKTNQLSDVQYKVCLSKLKKENDLCLYEKGKNQSLSPHLDCDSLSYALNHAALRADYQDCPTNSDQLAATNFSRVLLNITKDEIKPFSGPCSAVSAGETFIFNEKLDNDENWTLEACYFDKIRERDICSKTFFGAYSNHPLSYTNVVASILKETRGAGKNLVCEMVDSEDYNNLMLQYKSGCHIVYNRNKCFMSECKHKIMYNDREIDFIKIKNGLQLDYFPVNLKGERFSLHYLLSTDFKQNAKSLNNLSAIKRFYKTSKSKIIYGVGCAEDLLPSFFKAQNLNQCTPLPFILDGLVKEEDSIAFIARTAADSLQAPRIISWSNIFSGVKTYQRYHPLKIWTLYGLD
jgi:hypothetical protein